MPNSFFVNADFEQSFRELGLTTIEAVFAFQGDKNLSKDNLADFRNRVQFTVNSPAAMLFLKRYKKPPIFVQLKNWLSHHSRKSCGLIEFEQIKKLSQAGINTPKIVSFGQQWGLFFEKRSFLVTEKIPNAESIERKLPYFFNGTIHPENLRLRRAFIRQLAIFIKKFHQTGYRHRDLYFSHIFYSDSGKFYLIDLARAFKPLLFRRRFLIKDIAQLHYSAPSQYFSNTERLRFYLGYVERDRLTNKDKVFIRKLLSKAQQMAKHNIKYKRPIPFAKN
jgi:tRNA A-37 threonylcarbamoyl transferase component Bud32